MGMPPVLLTGAGTAVAGAGKALLPLIDKLANTMIADNPVLLEDLRYRQQQGGAAAGVTEGGAAAGAAAPRG